MTRHLPRAHLTDAHLLRFLTENGMLNAVPLTEDIGQRLGQWLNFRQAIAQAPQNAGPINSQMLVLRSLGLMHDASADYLSRFMVYVDTLLYLDEAASDRVALRRPSGAAGSKT